MLPRVLVVRIVDFGRRRRIVAETAVVAAVQARVAVHPAAVPLVHDRAGFTGRWRQRLRRRREERGRRWYVPTVLTGHHRGGHGRRRRPVAVGPTVGPGPRLCTRKTRFRRSLTCKDYCSIDPRA